MLLNNNSDENDEIRIAVDRCQEILKQLNQEFAILIYDEKRKAPLVSFYIFKDKESIYRNAYNWCWGLSSLFSKWFPEKSVILTYCDRVKRIFVSNIDYSDDKNFDIEVRKNTTNN